MINNSCGIFYRISSEKTFLTYFRRFSVNNVFKMNNSWRFDLLIMNITYQGSCGTGWG